MASSTTLDRDRMTLVGADSATPAPPRIPAASVSVGTGGVRGIVTEGQSSSAISGLTTAIEANWSNLQKAQFSDRLFKKIMRMASTIGGPSSRLRPLRASSLDDFLEFWSHVRDVAEEPEVGLAADGTICAEWYKSPRQKLDVRFVANRAVFGLIANKDIVEGADTLKSAAAILRNHPTQPLSWNA